MKVLSLFDGVSCARLALERAGIPIEVYYASEIDKYAIKVTQANRPDTIQTGNVLDLLYYYKAGRMEQNFDLLIGGSPCVDLSISKSKSRKGLEGEKSSLFWEYAAILDTIKPKYFILENVASMSDMDKNTISKVLGVEPIEINANYFSAQDRARYFWTNIPGVELPRQENHVMLGDILESNVDEKYYYKDVHFEIKDFTKRVIGTIDVAGHDLLKRIYNRLMKSPTITTCGGGNTQHKVYDNHRVRKLTPSEYESLQCMPSNWTNPTGDISNSQRYKMCGNAFNVDVVAHILSFIKTTP